MTANKDILNATTRFSDRVDDYVKYRPSYPKESIDFLMKQFVLGSGSSVADVGSGTGIFTKLLLERGLEVFAIEPNEQMRAAADKMLGTQKGFHSVAASAESTGLNQNCVDLVTAVQAFHWFDPIKAQAEFTRILKPGGGVALIWNSRSEDDSAFARGYETMLKTYGTDYELVNHSGARNLKAIDSFWPHGYKKEIFAHFQKLDLAGIKGRLMSSSYAPKQGHPSFAPMIKELERLFDSYSQDGVIELRYDTEIFYGTLK